MKISVCMIVKNEESVLERILSQAKQFADEIIIVDTGSTDSTKQIAEKFTDKVFDFEWKDDFAAARNFSFDKASNSYLMWLDADDVITTENTEKILELKNSNTDADVFMMKYQVAFDQFENPIFEYYRERIVKNTPNLRWKGFVHEAIEMQGRIEYCDIAIQHRKIEKARDVSRNLRIYESHIKNGELLDARSQFYYARELYFNNRIDEAIVAFKDFLKMSNIYLPNRIDAHLMLSKCYLLQGEQKKAEEILIDSMNYAFPNAEICCALGEIYYKSKNLQASEFWYKSATIMPPDIKSGGFVQKDFYDFIPYLQLSCLYYRQNNLDMFEYYHEKAKSVKPEHPSIVFNEQFVKKL